MNWNKTKKQIETYIKILTGITCVIFDSCEDFFVSIIPKICFYPETLILSAAS